MPNPVRRAATASGVLVALFVTNATRLPAARRRATASGAPGTTSVPRYRTPSRSNRNASYASASTAVT